MSLSRFQKQKRYRYISTSIPPLFSFLQSPVASIQEPFSFPAPFSRRISLGFLRLSKLNCTLDSPFTFHFLSARKTLFSSSSLAFIETQPGGVLRFHWTRSFVIVTIVISLCFSYLYSLRLFVLFTSDLPLLLVSLNLYGFLYAQHCMCFFSAA